MRVKIERLNEILEDLEINRHMWDDDHTVHKVVEAFEILRDLIKELAKRSDGHEGIN